MGTEARKREVARQVRARKEGREGHLAGDRVAISHCPHFSLTAVPSPAHLVPQVSGLPGTGPRLPRDLPPCSPPLLLVTPWVGRQMKYRSSSYIIISEKQWIISYCKYSPNSTRDILIIENIVICALKCKFNWCPVIYLLHLTPLPLG